MEDGVLATLLGYSDNNGVEDLSGWQRDVKRFLKKLSQGLLLRCMTGRDIGSNLDGTPVFYLDQALGSIPKD